MSIWKHIVSYFRVSTATKTVPEDVQVDIPITTDTGKEAVIKLIDRINFVGTDKEHQNAERKTAYESLSRLKACDEAIPCLIACQFNRDKWERDLAKRTLQSACPNWPSSQYALGKIDFLIDKLLKEESHASRARSLLSEIGSPAEPELIKRLDQKQNDDDRCTLILFLAKRECERPEFLIILRSIISTMPENDLLAKAIESLGHFETLDEELQAQLRTLLDHDSTDVRLSVLRVMASEINTTFKPDLGVAHALIQCLADPDDKVGKLATDLLSKSPETFSEPFVTAVLAARGEFTTAMAQEFWNRIENVLPTEPAASWQEWNNRTWRMVGLAEARQKPIRLLKRVLFVLRNAERIVLSEGHYRMLREILSGDGRVPLDVEIITSCIGILGQRRRDPSDIPSILMYLPHKDRGIRKAALSSLEIIDPKWEKRSYSETVLLDIIDGLDTSEHKEVSADVLESLASRALPAINKKLSETTRNKKLGETTSWTLQVRLVQILDLIGEAAIASWWFLVDIHKVSHNDHVRSDVRELILKLKGIMRKRLTESNLPDDTRVLYELLYDSYDPDSSRSRYPYDVVLSFASEERPYVEEVAEHLKSLGHSIFFYPERVAELTNRNGYDEFKEVFTNQGLFCLVFASAHYASKEWTMHELRSAQEVQFKRRQDYIIVAQFDETVLDGISVFKLGIDCRQYKAREVAHIVDRMIKKRKGM